MTDVDRLVEHAARYAETHPPGLPPQPRMQVAVLACMDSRMPLFRILGLEVGEAHLLRNAGGIVTEDVLRSLSLSQALLGTRSVVIIQHTNCGLLLTSEEEYAETMEREAGRRPPWKAGCFTDLEASVREAMQTVRDSPFVPYTDDVRGFVFDVDTGALTEVR